MNRRTKALLITPFTSSVDLICTTKRIIQSRERPTAWLQFINLIKAKLWWRANTTLFLVVVSMLINLQLIKLSVYLVHQQRPILVILGLLLQYISMWLPQQWKENINLNVFDICFQNSWRGSLSINALYVCVYIGGHFHTIWKWRTLSIFMFCPFSHEKKKSA